MPSNRVARYAEMLVIAVVAWGALAFGAVYPWAYVPLACLGAVAAIISLG